MKKLLTICAAAGLIMAVTGTAQGDVPAALDVNTIIMTSCKDYNDGVVETLPWNFEIWVDFDNPGTLDHIDVNMTGGLSSFTINGDFGDWEYESPTDYLTLGDLRAVYPTGDYTLEFFNNVDFLLDSVTLDYSGISEPCSPVSFNYPIDNSTAPTFTWTVGPTDGNALGMWVLDDTDNDVYENVPALMSTLDWTPGLLDPNDYYLEVSVIGVKDGELGPSLPTENMDIGNDEFEYALLIEYCNGIEFTTVPEPATIALLGLGSLALFRRKAKA